MNPTPTDEQPAAPTGFDPAAELRLWAWPHVPMMLLALSTMTFAGIGFAGGDPFSADAFDPEHLRAALGFSLPAFAIILAHELGHYVQSRRHGVPTTPPYFLPGLPIPGYAILPFFGTFGAFIRMRMERRIPARALLDIGAWGPLAGFVVTVPVLLAGFALSEVRPLPADPGAMLVFGDSLLLLFGEWLFHPNIPAGHDVYLHPMGMAGWVGCLLTALNLLPVGQLDGGHIAYSAFGAGFNRVAPLLFAGLVGLGLFCFSGWLGMATLVFFIGVRHPPLLAAGPARGRDVWPAWASLAVFALTFAPAPIEGLALLDTLALW